MKKLVLLIFPLMLFCLLPGSVGQEAFKFGVVDLQRVLVNYNKAIEVDKLLKAADKRWKEKLATIRDDISTLQEKKEKTELFVDEAETANLVKEIELKQLEYQQEFNQGREALFEKQNELMAPILKDVEELIVKLGKDDNYDLIIDKQAVFYMNEKHDLTDKLIGMINATGAEEDTGDDPEDVNIPQKANGDAE